MPDGKESREKFKRADVLFREERFAEALVLLTELDAIHPNTRNILVPMALCLDRLGREEEALPMCERLVRQFADTRARELLERLRLPRALPAVHVDALLGDQDYAGAYELPDLGPITTVPVPAQSEDEDGSRWPMLLLCGGCVLLIVGLLALPFIMGGTIGSEAASSDGATPTAEEAGFLVGFFLGAFAVSIFSGTLAGTLALGALGKLPANTIGGVVLDVGGTILVVNLISAVMSLFVMEAESVGLVIAVAFVQFAILLYAFYRNYRLGAGELTVFAVMYLVITCVLALLPLMAIVGVAGIFAVFTG